MLECTTHAKTGIKKFFFSKKTHVPAFVAGTSSGQEELDHEETKREDEQGGSGDQAPSPPRPAPVMAAIRMTESQGHLNKLRAASGQEDTTADQGQPSSPRATCVQSSGGLSFDELTLEDFKLPPEARDAFAMVAPQLQNTELASPEHLAAQLEAVAWKVSLNYLCVCV